MNVTIAKNRMPNQTRLSGSVLVVDDHAQARESIADVLRRCGHAVECRSSAVEGVAAIEKDRYDVLVTDLNMPGMSGLELIRKLEGQTHAPQIVMITAYATVNSAVEAMRHGAFDYIEKPFDVDQLEQLIERAISQARLMAGGPAALDAQGSGIMIGSSTAMRALRARIAQVGPTSETVLITGESGTGKELVARAVHEASKRASAALISLNCPVLSAHLMESELFGHERGAFTGADTPRTGRFELADGGTILLDEVTEIALPLQAKLLRVLQEKTLERVGSSQTIHVDARVLASTNRDLRSEVAAGRFREDLYYRLNVLPLQVPPLRDRREDLPELTQHFLRQAAARLEREPCSLESGAQELLWSYEWPGNVRELENIMTRASILSEGRPISADQVRPWLIGGDATMPASTDEVPVGLSLDDMERKMIEATLERFGGHRAKAAEALGIGLRTLSGKLKAYGYAPRTKTFTKAA